MSLKRDERLDSKATASSAANEKAKREIEAARKAREEKEKQQAHLKNQMKNVVLASIDEKKKREELPLLNKKNRPSAESSSAKQAEKLQTEQFQNDAAIAALIAKDVKRSDLEKNKMSVAIQALPSGKTSSVKTILSKPKKVYKINPTSHFEKILGQAPVINNIMSYFEESSKAANNLTQEDIKHQPIKEPLTKSDRLKLANLFIQTSKANPLTDLFKEKVLEAELKRQAKELCQYVVYGNYDKVKEILDKNPKLVLYKAKVQDYSFYEEEDELDENGKKKRIYREHEGTALQLALGAEDMSRKDHPDEGMADLIKGYFVKACQNDEKAAHAEIVKQFEEQFSKNEFPECYEADEKKREEMTSMKNADDPDTKVIEDIVKALQDCKVNDTAALNQDKTLQDALKAFRNYFKPKNIIKKGKHFNMQMLIKAFELYDEKYKIFGVGYANHEYDSPKNMFFWQKIIGYIQRFLPACYAQAFCQGLYCVVDENKKLERKLTFYYGGTYYPLDSDPSCRLGYEWAVGGGGGWARDGGAWAGVWGGLACFAKLMSGKNTQAALLYATSGQLSQKESMRDFVGRRCNNS